MTRQIRLFTKNQLSRLLPFVLAAPVGWLGCAPKPAAQVLSVAAAADLQFALDDGSHAFRASHPGVDLRIAYGSSGNFFAQIRNQAPFDVFLSADAEYPRQLIQQGVGVPDSLFVYALGGIAVWVASASPLDPATALQSTDIRHFAIANPQHAPYGRAAEGALRTLGVYDRLKEKLVFGENVAQTLEFVQSGAADAGIIALSLAMAPSVRNQGRYWEVPRDKYPKLEQGGVIVKDSPAARDFRAWLLSPAGARILQTYGFSLPAK
jgi:molybdate transport system substrate-binding protein